MAPPKPVKTIAARASTHAPVKARRPTTTRANGNMSTRGRAKRLAARWPRRRLSSIDHSGPGHRGPVGIPMPPASNRLPSKAGIGLRAPHVNEVLAQRPDVAFFEVHSENYYLDGGPALASLARIRADYPLSLHGVGMSLGSADPLDRLHVEKLRTLIARIEHALGSEHSRWSGIGGRHLNDLVQFPF